MSQARARLEALFRATLAGLDPAARVTAALEHTAGDAALQAAWSPRAVVMVAAGKAAHAMAAGAADHVRDRGIELLGGVVVTPCARASYTPGHAQQAHTRRLPDSLAVMAGSHPVPDERSVAAARAVQAAVAGAPARPGVEILALISGGASALMAMAAPGLTLDDKIAATSAVYASGASIAELNIVRKHLSAIKGGRLAALAPVPVLTLVSSDVVGDDLATVGSGPTLPDPSTFARARDIVARAAGWARVPPAVRTYLEQGAAGHIADTPARPRPGDRAVLAAGTDALLDQAVAAAARAGLAATIFARGVTGDVADVARRVAGEARRIAAARPAGPRLFVAGGEPTIVMPEPGQHGEVGQPGGTSVGGRAQHLALLLARELAGIQGITVLVAGSDGIDGNSPAAGAVIDGHTVTALERAGVDPGRALDRRDSHTALAAVGAALFTGATGINHADLIVIAAGV